MSVIGEGLHQAFEFSTRDCRIGAAGKRSHGAAELARRHPPERIRRQPQNAKTKTDHLFPGERLCHPHASCGSGGPGGLSPTPNVAAISALTIRT